MMQVDELEADAEISSSQPPSRDDGSWPVERTPSRLDAERAHRPLDLAFVQSFKHAILSHAAHDVEYLTDANEIDIHASHPKILNTYYPLTIPIELPKLPLDPVPRTLIDAFRTECHPNMPLINHVAIECFTPAKLSNYLAYGIATLGSLIRSSDPASTHSLWTTAIKLIAFTLEVDNREARKADLINAWALLATYGALCADPTTWQQTNTTQGYVGTAARRLCNDRASIVDCLVMPAFLLADVLRSVHYGDPLTVSTFECLSQPTQVNLASLTIYKSVMTEVRPPPAELIDSGSLTALVILLAKIHTLAHTFYPLTVTSASARLSTTFSHFNELESLKSNHIPLSISNETRLARRRLHQALDLWATAYLSASSPQTMVLFYFCKMYLALPALQYLPALAEYSPRIFYNTLTTDEGRLIVDSELPNAPEAQKYAWQILESLGQATDTLAPWLPIAIFYAALVVWRTVLLQPDSGTYGSRKVLIIFKEELKRMCWPCCAVMITTLEGLAA